MRSDVLVALIAAAPALVTAVVSVILNNRLIGYKLTVLEAKFDSLQAKVEKHNQIVERTAVCERDIKTAFNKMEEIHSDIGRIEDKLMKP